MTTVKIRLASIADVKNFVGIANDYPFDIDLISGRYDVDAKSIMGIFSLDLSKPLTVNVHTDECADFLERVAPFVAE